MVFHTLFPDSFPRCLNHSLLLLLPALRIALFQNGCLDMVNAGSAATNDECVLGPKSALRYILKRGVQV